MSSFISMTGSTNIAGDSSASQTNIHSDSQTETGGRLGPLSAASDVGDRKRSQASQHQQSMFIHFRAIMQGLTVRAVLLPSLEAQYKVNII